MGVKKSFPILIVLMFLALQTGAPLLVFASPSPVTVLVEMPDGFIPEKPVGTKFWVNFLIDADDLEYNGPGGMIYWKLLVQVDPGILTPFMVKTSSWGYFLYDFAMSNGYDPPQYAYSIDEGLVEVSEFFVLLPPGGAATDPFMMPAPYLLVSIAYEVVGSGSTLIDIFGSGYSVLEDPETVLPMEEVDGWYGEPVVPEFPLGLALEILFIPVIIYILWRSKQTR